MSIKGKKVGYSFWGFLGDIKYNYKGKIISTPDGNAFYSWSIIRALQKEGFDVIQVMPDRDYLGAKSFGSTHFSAWCKDKRFKAYLYMYKSCTPEFLCYEKLSTNWTREFIWRNWYKLGLHECDFILHEWRMVVKGRNDLESRNKEGWQPDLMLQNELISFCAHNNITLVIFDLDYKLTEEDVKRILKQNVNVKIIELGTKWREVPWVVSSQTFVPFDFESINSFNVLNTKYCYKDLVYVGNRYERDWCVDWYIPKRRNIYFYGNWEESHRGSKKLWPFIKFEHRAQTYEMRNIYASSLCTILFAKREYCTYEFMTARVLESIFYGTVPLFIEEYGQRCIKTFAGGAADILTVEDSKDVKDRIRFFKDSKERETVINYLRKYLNFMDAKYFVKNLLQLAACK